ncbi:BTAD domain-containing putative transcriptional regulator [Streptomyces olivaceoviridis]
MRFAVLGPIRAWHRDREVDLGSPQQRAVLAAMLLRQGKSVTVEQLVDAVWGDSPSPGAVSTARTYVSRLRKVLEPDRAARQPPRTVVSVAGGYALRYGDGALDMADFEDRTAEGKRLAAEGSTARAASVLASALELWQGTALGGVPGPLAETERTRLAELRMAALESRIDIDLRLGRHDDVVAELTALSTANPLRERLWALRMLALYRCGRRADALRTYREIRDVLVAELGMEPGRELQKLHADVLSEDPGLMVPEVTADPMDARPSAAPRTGRETTPAEGDNADRALTAAPSGLSVRPHQLPSRLPVFVGREAEIARVTSLLQTQGEAPTVIAISGMAGVGKTALAVDLAHTFADRFPEGHLYINLRGFDPTGAAVEPTAAIPILLTALGVDPQQIPRDADSQTALYRSVLAHRRLLIVLDNAHSSDHVRPLLPGTPGCLILITSRDRLTGLVASHGAFPVALEVLEEQQAVNFLSERIGEARTAAEPLAVRDIVRACARLPLALALVAAHAATHPTFPLSLVAGEFDETAGSLDSFESSDSTLDVRAVFSWSYRTLTPESARLFRLLSLHPGPRISAASAAALAGLQPRKARTLLAELTQSHLLSEPTPRVFALHDLLGHYAAELAEETDTREDLRAAQHRLFDHYLHTAISAGPLLKSVYFPVGEPVADCGALSLRDLKQVDAWTAAELATMVALVDQAAREDFTVHSWQLASALMMFDQRPGSWHNWEGAARTALAASERARDLLGQAHTHKLVGRILMFSPDRADEAVRHLANALHIFTSIGDVACAAYTHNNIGAAEVRRGNLEAALIHVLRSLDMFQAIGDRKNEAREANNAGWVYAQRGLYEQALALCSRGLALSEEIRDESRQAATLDSLGNIHHHMRNYEQAADTYERGLRLARSRGDHWDEADVLFSLGTTHRAAGRTDAARAAWEEALALFEGLGHGDAEQVRKALRELEAELS